MLTEREKADPGIPASGRHGGVMKIRSQTAAAYRIIQTLGALIWLACAFVAAAILVMEIRTPDKNAWQYCLIILLGILAVIFLNNFLALLGQNFKSVEITDGGETVRLKQFGRTVTLRPEEITQVRLEEKNLLYSFSLRPRQMLVIEADGVLWQIRSDTITYYDRVINYFMEKDEDGTI